MIHSPRSQLLKCFQCLQRQEEFLSRRIYFNQQHQNISLVPWSVWKNKQQITTSDIKNLHLNTVKKVCFLFGKILVVWTRGVWRGIQKFFTGGKICHLFKNADARKSKWGPLLSMPAVSLPVALLHLPHFKPSGSSACSNQTSQSHRID